MHATVDFATCFLHFPSQFFFCVYFTFYLRAARARVWKMSENCADNNKTRWRGENGGQGERQVAKWQVAMTAAVAAESADRNWTQAECDIINGGICKRRKAPKKLAKIYPIYICKGGYIAKRINTHNYGTRKGGQESERKAAQKDCENK